MPTLSRSTKKSGKKSKKAPAKKKEVVVEPPRLGRGVTRSAVNRSRNPRGMMGSDNSMMLRSVLNSVNNMPAYLQRHVDERMQKMHSDLLFRADEKKRNEPKAMDVDPPPQPEPMDAEAPPPPPADVPMPQQPPLPSSRDPLMSRQVASMASSSSSSRPATWDAVTQTTNASVTSSGTQMSPPRTTTTSLVPYQGILGQKREREYMVRIPNSSLPAPRLAANGPDTEMSDRLLGLVPQQAREEFARQTSRARNPNGLPAHTRVRKIFTSR